MSFGRHYTGPRVSDNPTPEGIEPPLVYWVPSIAVCPIDFYDGTAFSGWKNDLLVGGLGAQVVERFRLDGKGVVEHEVILKNQGRVRDLIAGPDGAVYLVMNLGRRGGTSAIKRLVPVDTE